MKQIKELLDFLITLVNAWKVVLPILLLVLSAVIAVLKFGTQNITITLPAWIFLIFIALALYPFGKFVEYAIKRKESPQFKLYGLIWKAPFISFLYPKPLCPHDGCGREVVCKEIPPQPMQVVTSLADFNNIKYEYRYFYECPIHGKINGVPSEDISFLQHKAKLAMKK